MTGRLVVNILHRYDEALFAQHFSGQAWDVIENGPTEREWDLLIVFEAMKAPASYRVRGGHVVFVGGEPPEIGNHSRTFLKQFAAVYCAGAAADVAPYVSYEQHFNNWHFGYSRSAGFRYDHAAIRDLPAPTKSRVISTITSNLNYLPMHIRRRALMERLAEDYSGHVDVFGRPHRYVEYKEDAILPYRFHLCVENCVVPGVWTEKIADAILSYSIPVYAGCPDIENYFPGVAIPIDLDNYSAAKDTIDALLRNSEAIYAQRLPALIAARKRLIEDFDIASLIGERLKQVALSERFETISLRPEADLPLFRGRDLWARIRRKVNTLLWQHKVALRA